MKTPRISAKKSVHLINLHPYCDSNSLIWARVNLFFSLNGYKISPDIEGADVLVITGCASSDMALERNETVVSNSIKSFPHKTVVLFGCMIPFLGSRNSDRVVMIKIKDLDKLSLLFESTIPVSECRTAQFSEDFYLPDSGVSKKDRFVQISQGCSSNCSYCNIKIAKGAAKSVPPSRIKAEVVKLIAEKIDEITLVSDDCGSYGHDINTNIAELFRQLPETSHAGSPLKFKIPFLFPGFLIKYYPQLKPAFLNHRIIDLTVPLQSGAPRILKLMNREYDLRKLSHILREIREKNPQIRIDSHFIFNFPSETMAEFRRSLYYAQLFDFSAFFLYCDNKRTPASGIYPKCTEEESERKMLEIKSLIKNKTIKGLVMEIKDGKRLSARKY